MAAGDKCYYTPCRSLSDGNSRYCPLHEILPPEVVQNAAARRAVIAVLARLTFREREIVKLSTGFGDGDTFSSRDIAKLFKVTEARIQDISAKSIKHLVRNKSKEALSGYALPDIDPIVVAAEAELISELAKCPSGVFELSPRRFEEIIAYVLKQFGFEVELTKATRDGGRDILAVTRDRLGILTSYLIECKKYGSLHPVGVPICRAVYGVKAAEGRDHAIIATTSRFTSDAVSFATKPTVLNLHLKDFKALSGWFKDVNGLALPMRDATSLRL